jgi:ribosomal protein L16/L10AE
MNGVALTEKVYTAQINGDRMECGKCGALLQIVMSCGKGTKLEIKCKHKENGHTCNAINRIEL